MENITYRGGENFNLRDVLINGRKRKLNERVALFGTFISEKVDKIESLYSRVVNSACDREVEIIDAMTNTPRKMLMFGSNNYLGLANHPYVKEKVKEAINRYGVGVGGPPLLNGYTSLHRELEEKLSALKSQEDTLLFSSGYNANVGLISGLVDKNDLVIHDEYSHASLCDGLKLARANSKSFKHNNIDELKNIITDTEVMGEKFICVEGVYSMDGDLAPLDEITQISNASNSILIVDDAHGTGVMGKHGRGTGEHFNVENLIDINMGTFSKAFGVVGGFISASKALISYLRFFARSYMFSASLPPTVISAVLAGLEVIQNEPERIEKLHKNTEYLSLLLSEIGIKINSQTPIISVIVPQRIDIRKAAYEFHQAGIFLNAIEYPAVPISKQRFRISLMADHRKEDLERLVECLFTIWHKNDNSYSTQNIIHTIPTI
ncbi:MAG: transferase [Ignavibacteriae bacterium]|nr:transferase [Ignavibacteriota bacterium]